MRNRILVLITLSLSLIPAISYGDNAFRLIEVPDFFKNTNSIKVLSDSLKSTREDTRRYSAIRLGELKDPSAINALKEAYDNEPYHYRIDYGYSVGYYCLRSVGSIGGPQAEQVLNDLASMIFVYDVIGKNRVHYDDTLYIIHGLFEAIVEIKGYEDAKYFLDMALDSNIYYLEREKAYESYLRVYIKNPSFLSYADSMNYLLDEKKNTYRAPKFNNDNERTMDYIKDEALHSLIIKYGEKDPGIIDLYGNNLAPDDPYADSLEILKRRVENRLRIIDNYNNN
ncbi:MAG: HEAT repeat domain-containing protein [Candidatus Zixiibacteriota bacterium]|nr:MAG: HEAT repeat domain-containing protein [candidate division Zixibacteria bacterium]